MGLLLALYEHRTAGQGWVGTTGTFSVISDWVGGGEHHMITALGLGSGYLKKGHGALALIFTHFTLAKPGAWEMRQQRVYAVCLRFYGPAVSV